MWDIQMDMTASGNMDWRWLECLGLSLGNNSVLWLKLFMSSWLKAQFSDTKFCEKATLLY